LCTTIINHFGSSLFDRRYRGSANINENARIVMSSTLHSIHAISALLTPEGMIEAIFEPATVITSYAVLVKLLSLDAVLTCLLLA
jgi:hypothetical protein